MLQVGVKMIEGFMSCSLTAGLHGVINNCSMGDGVLSLAETQIYATSKIYSSREGSGKDLPVKQCLE